MRRSTKQVGDIGRNLGNGPAPLDGSVDQSVVMKATAEECLEALCARPALGDRKFTVGEDRYELRERYVGHMQHYIACNEEEVPLQEVPLHVLRAWCIHAGRTPKRHKHSGFGFGQIKKAIAAATQS